MKNYVELFFQAEVALPVRRVEFLASVYNFPIDLVSFPFIFQLPDVGRQGGFVLLIPVPEAAGVNILPLLEGVRSQSCVGGYVAILLHHLGLVDHLLDQAIAIQGALPVR